MSVLNPEYREFFFTEAGVPLIPYNPIDTPAEQDDPVFNREKVVGGMVIGVVLKEDHEPGENTWNKFAKSTLFKLNASDRAKDSDSPEYASPINSRVYGGHVTVATDPQAKAWDNGIEAEYTRVPRVSQLPDVNEAVDAQVTTFYVDAINDTPVTPVDVNIDPTVAERNNFLIGFTDAFRDWLLTTADALAAYTNSVNVIAGTADITSSGPSQVVIDVTPHTPTNSNTFQVNVTVGIDNDVTLSASNPNGIPSQHAVKTYVDNLAATLTGYATAIDLSALLARVDIMEGAGAPSATLKANQTDLDALATLVGTKLSKTTDDTAAGIITFVQSPVVPSGATGMEAINYDDMVAYLLANYYDRTAIDSMFSARDAQIVDLQSRVSTLETQVANLIANTYTKAEVDALLANKADVGHNHDSTYHPLITGSYTGQRTLDRLSAITVTQGIVTGITT